jgi:hypothetical protein
MNEQLVHYVRLGLRLDGHHVPRTKDNAPTAETAGASVVKTPISKERSVTDA